MNGTAKRRILQAKLRQDLHPLYLRAPERVHKPITEEGLRVQVARARAAMVEAMMENVHGYEGIPPTWRTGVFDIPSPVKWSGEQSTAVVDRGLESVTSVFVVPPRATS